MYIPKRYGQSKIDKCPFCSQQATTSNKQGMPVCNSHKNSSLDDMKCICGSILEMKNGKYGTFFRCINCGNMNLKKVLEINEAKEVKDIKNNDVKNKDVKNNDSKDKDIKDNKENEIKRKPREIIVRSDDPRYF